jgi:hypothetical protein
MVVDDLGSECGDGALDGWLVAQVESMRLRLWVEIGLVAGAEVVDDRNLMAGCDVSIDHVGTDETGSARHQNPHRK